MPSAILTRSALALPARDEVEAAVGAIDALEQAAHAALPLLAPDPLAVGRIRRMLDDEPRSTWLEHRLSHHWMARRAQPGRDRDARCAETELRRFLLARTALTEASTACDRDRRIEALCLACAQLTGAPTASLRDRDVGLEPDADGTRVVFGTWGDVPDRLDQLFDELSDPGLPPALQALAAMAILLNIHPFRDGNGRVARALFSVILGTRWSIDVYLPLHLFLERSAGGFELRLREAEILGRWQPLIEYFTTLLRATAHGRRPEAA